MGFLRSLLSISELTNPSFVELSPIPTPSLPDGCLRVIEKCFAIILKIIPSDDFSNLPTGFGSGAGRIDTTVPFTQILLSIFLKKQRFYSEKCTLFCTLDLFSCINFIRKMLFSPFLLAISAFP